MRKLKACPRGLLRLLRLCSERGCKSSWCLRLSDRGVPGWCGYFAPRASGKPTFPQPSARSFSCSFFNFYLSFEFWNQRFRKHYVAVFVAFSVANDDFVPVKLFMTFATSSREKTTGILTFFFVFFLYITAWFVFKIEKFCLINVFKQNIHRFLIGRNEP